MLFRSILLSLLLLGPALPAAADEPMSEQEILRLFPGTFRVLAAGRPASIRAVQRHLDEGVPLVLAPQLDADEGQRRRQRRDDEHVDVFGVDTRIG